MKKGFSQEQIGSPLRQWESGTPVAEIRRLKRLVADLVLDKQMLQSKKL